MSLIPDYIIEQLAPGSKQFRVEFGGEQRNMPEIGDLAFAEELMQGSEIQGPYIAVASQVLPLVDPLGREKVYDLPFANIRHGRISHGLYAVPIFSDLSEEEAIDAIVQAHFKRGVPRFGVRDEQGVRFLDAVYPSDKPELLLVEHTPIDVSARGLNVRDPDAYFRKINNLKRIDLEPLH